MIMREGYKWKSLPDGSQGFCPLSVVEEFGKKIGTDSPTRRGTPKEIVKNDLHVPGISF